MYQFETAQHSALLDPNQGPTALIQGQALTYLLTGLLGAPMIIDPTTLGAKDRPAELPVTILEDLPVRLDIERLVD